MQNSIGTGLSTINNLDRLGMSLLVTKTIQTLSEPRNPLAA